MATMVTGERRHPARQFFDLLQLRAQNYYRVGHWIVSDSLWRFRRSLVVYLGAAGLAIASQAAALGIFISYARHLESRTEWNLGGLLIEPAGSYILLLIAIGLGGTLLILASFLKLFADRGFYELGQRYAVICTERLIVAVSQALHATRSSVAVPGLAQLKKLAIAGSQICARTLYGMMNILPNLVGLIVYATFLVYLDPVLTAVLLVTLAAPSLLFYLLSVESAKLIPRREERRREMNVDFDQLVSFLKYGAAPLHQGDPFLESKIQGSFSNFFKAFFKSRIVSALTTNVGAITQALALMMIALVKGGEIISTGRGFGDLIILLMAGRMAVSAFLGISGSLVMINRFYPTVATYFETFERLTRLQGEHSSNVAPTPWQALCIVAEPLTGRKASARPLISRGERLSVVTPRMSDRFVLLDVVSRLRAVDECGRTVKGRIPPSQCWLVPEELLRAGLSFAAATGLPPHMDPHSLRRQLFALGLNEQALQSLPADLGATMLPEEWDKLSSVVFWGASVCAAQLAQSQLIMISARALDELESVDVSLNSAFGCSVLLVAYRPKDVTRAGSYGERYVLIHGEEKALARYLHVEDVPEYAGRIQAIERYEEKDAGRVMSDGFTDEEL